MMFTDPPGRSMTRRVSLNSTNFVLVGSSSNSALAMNSTIFVLNQGSTIFIPWINSTIFVLVVFGSEFVLVPVSVLFCSSCLIIKEKLLLQSLCRICCWTIREPVNNMIPGVSQ